VGFGFFTPRWCEIHGIVPVPREVVHCMLPELARAVEARNGYITATSEHGFEFGSDLIQLSIRLLTPVSWGGIELREREGEHEID
jgi:hypothetical protein